MKGKSLSYNDSNVPSANILVGREVLAETETCQGKRLRLLHQQ